ncbi:MAG: peptide-methionine (S)-S-oxide reductase MsrA [Oscillospiraceae bacterium]|jgi:methionine-S-sulfoxide reductase|nr:peptide-methionine (S)-S-oxide reductase MsrA [Oscillospiraceae bacterium]
MHKTMHLAGGCFWGLEKYLSLLPGVIKTDVGYANGRTEHPSYEDVCRGSGHAETVRVSYDPEILDLASLLEAFYEAIDPTTVGRQGADVGMQYRTGVYYEDAADLDTIRHSLAALEARLDKPVAVEARPLRHYYRAEDAHQKYLDKHPDGYCHIGPAQLERARRFSVNPVRSQNPNIHLR